MLFSVSLLTPDEDCVESACVQLFLVCCGTGEYISLELFYVLTFVLDILHNIVGEGTVVESVSPFVGYSRQCFSQFRATDQIAFRVHLTVVVEEKTDEKKEGGVTTAAFYREAFAVPEPNANRL